MADEYGLFWNSQNGDRPYNADSFSEWLQKFFTTGVFQNDLQVVEYSGMTVTVGTGYANIKGKVRFFDQSANVTLSPASGSYPRIDTIVVERNDTDRAITLKAVTGAYSGDSPAATAPVRSGAVYQIVLAEIRVEAGATAITQADITDKRADSSVCGWVTSTVDELDISQWLAQAEAEFAEWLSDSQSEFTTWFNAMKDQLSTDAAGHLQQEVESTIKSFTVNAIDWDGTYNTYTIEDTLITATSNQEVIPALNVTQAQMKAWAKAMVVDNGQATGEMYLKALGTVPSVDIPVRVIFRGVK